MAYTAIKNWKLKFLTNIKYLIIKKQLMLLCKYFEEKSASSNYILL